MAGGGFGSVGGFNAPMVGGMTGGGFGGTGGVATPPIGGSHSLGTAAGGAFGSGFGMSGPRASGGAAAQGGGALNSRIERSADPSKGSSEFPSASFGGNAGASAQTEFAGSSATASSPNQNAAQ